MLAKARQWAALAIALLALFVALGGPGYATTTVNRAFAANAEEVDGFHASSRPKPRMLLALDRAGKLPASVLPLTTGPAGPAGAQGATGPPGTINGVVAGGDLAGAYPNPALKAGAVG